MNKKIALLLIIINLTLSNYTFSQLSGTYTIGGIGANYPTVDSAVDDLSAKGISGPVTFNINPGSYVSNNAYLYVTDNLYPIIFQSTTLDSSSVTIKASISSSWAFSGDTRNSNMVTFRELTLINFSGYAVLDNLIGAKVLNCVLTTSGTGNCIVNSNDAIVKNSLLGGNCSGPDYVSYSTITGSITSAPHNHFSLLNSTVNGYVYINVCDSCTVLNSKVNEYFHISNCPVNIVDSSIIDSMYIIYTGYAVVKNSRFNRSLNIFTDSSVTVINHCFIKSTKYIALFVGSSNNLRISNDSIVGQCSIGNPYSGAELYPPKIIDNVFIGGLFQVNQTDSVYIIGNRFIEAPCELDYCDSNVIFNNTFNGYLRLGYSYYSKVYNNNFSPSSPLISFGAYKTAIRNNNLSSDIPNYDNDTIVHNNFYPVGSVYDTAQTNYDPKYTDTVNLFATNPFLAGQGTFIPFVKYDIDSVVRPNPPSMGANEICFRNDTITISEGDTVTLVPCGISGTGTYSWTPVAGLNNPSLPRPNASPTSNTLYIIHGLSSSYVDSIYVKVIPYSVLAYSDMTSYCGDSVYLFTNYDPKATYTWTPLVGLSTPNSWHTQAKPPQTTTYTVTSTIPGHGTTTSSATVMILPLISGTYTDTCFTFKLTNQTTCGTSYHWNFGDTTFSDSFSVTHVYASAGTYLVTFTACNSTGCDSTQFSVYIPGCLASIAEIQNLYNFNCYPNPTTGKLTLSLDLPESGQNIEIAIYNIYGQEVYSEEKDNAIAKYTQEIDLSGNPNGIYLLRIKIRGATLSRKVIISK